MQIASGTGGDLARLPPSPAISVHIPAYAYSISRAKSRLNVLFSPLSFVTFQVRRSVHFSAGSHVQ